MVNVAPTPVDAEGWNDITEEDAIDNLSEAYGYLPFKEYKKIAQIG